MKANLRKKYNEWHQDNIKYKSKKHKAAEIKFYKDILNNLGRLNQRKNAAILDVACGRGRFLYEARLAGLNVTGMDISEVAAKEAAKLLGNGRVLRADSEKIPFSDSSFDFVSCIGSLEHFDNPLKALREMRRVLKKEGIIFLHVPNLMFLGHIYLAFRYSDMPSEGDQSFSEHYRTFGGWKQLISQAGLEILKCDKYNDMFASQRVGLPIKFIWQNLLRFFVPFNLSYAFNIYLKK